MAKDKLTDYSTTNASNTDVGGIAIQGSDAVSNFDNGLRELMTHLAETNAGTAPWADTMTIADPADLTKEARFDCGSITTATTRVFTLPDYDGTIATLAGTETLTNKTLTAAFVSVNSNGNDARLTSASTSDRLLIHAGGANGGQVAAYGSAHATNAGDVAILSSGSQKYLYDSSASQHQFTGTITNAAFSATGATTGWEFADTHLQSSRTGSAGSNRILFYNSNGQVGSIVTSGSATAYNTSSDERLKQNFRAFDSGAIIDAIKMHRFDWKAGGSTVGPKAQELHAVFPDAVTPGKGNPGEEGFQPWAWDASKLVPVLVKEVQELRKRLAVLERRP